MAETYHVLDWRALPLHLAAVLASGLHSESRCMMKISGNNVTTDRLLQAATLDRLSTLVWQQTEDGHKGKNHPESIVEKMIGKIKSKKVQSFINPAAFEKRRQEIIGGKRSAK